MSQKSVTDVISTLNLEDDIRDYVSSVIIDAIDNQTLSSSQSLEEIIGQHLLMHEIVSTDEEMSSKCKDIYQTLISFNLIKTSSSQNKLNSKDSTQSSDYGGKKLLKPVRIGNEKKEEKIKEEKIKEEKQEVRIRKASSGSEKEKKKKETGSHQKKIEVKEKQKSDGEEMELDQAAVTPRWEQKYFFSGAWKLELAVKDVKDWSPQELAQFVVALGKGKKWETLFNKVAGVIEANRLSGDLLLAGGAEQLVEQTLGIAHKDKSILKRNANTIFKSLKEKQLEKDRITQSSKDQPNLPNHKITVSSSIKEEKKKQKLDNYWKILCEGTDKEQEMIEEFKNSSLRSELKTILGLLPRQKIRYCAVEAPKFDVRYVNKMVSKQPNKKIKKKNSTSTDDDEADEEEIVKVVSVSTLDSPEIIERNFIYAKTKEGKWKLITSVDFEQHGTANPGHWHLNRAPTGELMEHWGVSISNIYHGHPKKCPLWWFLIPKGKRYNKTPDRSVLKEDEED